MALPTYNYDKAQLTHTTKMHPIKSQANTRRPNEDIKSDPPPDLIEHLDAIKAAIAEAEDLCAEFAIEMYLEGKRISKRIGEPR